MTKYRGTGHLLYGLIEHRIEFFRDAQTKYHFRDPLTITVNLNRRAGHTTAGAMLLRQYEDAIMLVIDERMKDRHRGETYYDRLFTYREVLSLFKGRVTLSMVIMDDFSCAVIPSEMINAMGYLGANPGYVEVRLG